MTTQRIKQVLYIYRDRDKTGRTLQKLCTKDKQIKLLSLRSIPSSLPLYISTSLQSIVEVDKPNDLLSH